MWFRLSIFLLIIVTAIAIYQQEEVTSYPFLRPFLRAGNHLKNIRSNSTKTSTAMASNSTFVGYPVIPTKDSSLDATSPKPRGIQQVFLAREQSEGAGATVRRSIGTPKLKNLSPCMSNPSKPKYLVHYMYFQSQFTNTPPQS